MKINLEYKKLVQVENELVKNNDRLLCETEKFKRMNNIERYAGKFGYRKYVPSDYNVLKIKGNNAK